MSEFRDIMNKVPAFTRYVKCPTCNGSGWKHEVSGFIPHMIVCPICKGQKKVPMLDDDARWMKKNIKDTRKENQRMS